MKLLRLILQGFKSFADKTTIEFAEGMTVIVGLRQKQYFRCRPLGTGRTKHTKSPGTKNGRHYFFRLGRKSAEKCSGSDTGS